MKKPLLALLTVALLLIAAVLPLMLPRRCPVNRAAFERIELGMTRAEVEAIVGGPPGDYCTQPSSPVLSTLAIFHKGPGHLMGSQGGPEVLERVEAWAGDEGDIMVCFDPSSSGDKRVSIAQYFEVKSYPPGFVELVRWRLGRLWEWWLP